MDRTTEMQNKLTRQLEAVEQTAEELTRVKNWIGNSQPTMAGLTAINTLETKLKRQKQAAGATRLLLEVIETGQTDIEVDVQPEEEKKPAPPKKKGRRQ